MKIIIVLILLQVLGCTLENPEDTANKVAESCDDIEYIYGGPGHSVECV